MLVNVLRIICRVLFRVEVTGIDNIPQDNKLLIIANHESFLDGFLLGLFLPVSATFVVHTSVLNSGLFRFVLRLTPYLAVNPSSPMAMKQVIKLLESNKPVVIFPEGRITLTGSLMKVYDGPGFVAAKTAATILPVRIDGAANSYFSRLTSIYPKNIFPKVRIFVLPCTHIAMPSAITSKERRHLCGNAMRLTMQNMMFSSAPVSTFFQAFLRAKKTYGRHKLVEDMRQIEENYGELLKKILVLGNLSTRVSSPNEIVGVLMPNVTNTICLIFGMTAFGRVPAMLNYTAGSASLQNACTAATIRTILTSKQFIESAKLAEVVAGLQNIKIVYLEDLGAQFNWVSKLWLMCFAYWLPTLALRILGYKQKSNEPAVVLFTSGSEGKPKGVVHSHGSILSNVAQVRSIIDFSPADKFMMVLPLFHSFGFTCGAILPLVTGTKLFLYPSPLHYRVIPEVIYDRGCTVLFGTSTFLGNYAKFANPYDFYKLRYVVAGAEKLNEEVRKIWMDKFGLRILEGYGSTECAPALSINTPMANKIGSVGCLMPGMEAHLDAVPGIDVGGLLSVKGPNVMMGYYLFDRPGVLIPPETAQGLGWYDTGDIVDIDNEGYISIKGRVKRFAKVAGEMVSLEVVEQLASEASPTQEHAATTQPDAQRGENIVLYTTDEMLTKEALQASARALGSPEISVPRKVLHLKELPLLGSGKIDYVTLKKMAETV